jgi:hypothetical protein
LSQHIHHLGLKDGIYGFDGNAGAGLWHGEDIHDPNGVVVDKLAQHQAHDFHGHTGATVPKHFEESEGGDVDGFGVVDDVGVLPLMLVAYHLMSVAYHPSLSLFLILTCAGPPPAPPIPCAAANILVNRSMVGDVDEEEEVVDRSREDGGGSYSVVSVADGRAMGEEVGDGRSRAAGFEEEVSVVMWLVGGDEVE